MVAAGARNRGNLNSSTHLRHVRVGSGDDVDGDDFTDAARGLCAGVNRGTDSGDVAPKGDRDQAAADLVLLDELHVRRLEGRVAGFDGCDDSLGFDQTDCFTVGHCYSSLRSVLRIISWSSPASAPVPTETSPNRTPCCTPARSDR